MSIRQARLCDHRNGAITVCDRPSICTCPICEKDCCGEHAGGASIIPTIVFNSGELTEGRWKVTALGVGAPVRICVECVKTLERNGASAAVGQTGAKLSLDDVAAKLDGEIVPAMRAFFALQATKTS